MLFKRKYKAAASDFTADKLPSNRSEVFFDVIKLRWMTLLGMGGIVVLFALPMLIASVVFSTVAGGMYAEYQAINDATAEQAQIILQQILWLNNIENLIYIPLFMLLSVGLAGVYRIIKRLAWAEGVDVLQDFNIGVKQNWKQFLFTGFVAGLLIFVTGYLSNVYSYNAKDGFTEIMSAMVSVLPIMLIPVAMFLLSGITIYVDKWRKLFKYSGVFYIKTVPKTLLMTLCTGAPFIIAGILASVSYIASIIITLVSVVAFVPWIILAWILYSCSVFDNFINRSAFPEIVDKGIWRKETADKGSTTVGLSSQNSSSDEKSTATAGDNASNGTNESTDTSDR